MRNGLTLPWSSGVVEGTVNRIKMIKRQMYGRAGFPLLRKRVLLATRYHHEIRVRSNFQTVLTSARAAVGARTPAGPGVDCVR